MEDAKRKKLTDDVQRVRGLKPLVYEALMYEALSY
jgi:hypothetical protein